MDWFKRPKEGLVTVEKKEMPTNVWVKCENCGEIIYRKELERNLFVCAKCSYHFSIRSHNYIEILIDDGTFQEFNEDITSVDILGFKDTKKYVDRIKDATEKSGMNDAVRTGFGKINGNSVVMAVMDFAFIGGSMGSVVGEKISRAIDKALEKKYPLIIISSSGGARMQESVLSLMQLAKTSAKLARLSDAGILYISILTDPTTGGVTASFAMLGDLIIAEPGALIGFAGPRVIKQTIGQDLPPGFQTSEFLLKHGFVDIVVNRQEMKQKLTEILKFFKDNHNND
jgi:acetyl-CoA carboxylase carboxyl transferase subunit beta